MNILFVMNSYPDVGGVTSVTNILAEYLGRKHNIYSVATDKNDEIPMPAGLKEAFIYDSTDKATWPEYYNRLTDRLDIDIVINQGMYAKFNRVIFNNKRNKKVKVISVLHGMPGYEIPNFWSRKRTSNIFKASYRRILKILYLHYGYHKCVNTVRHAYRQAAELSQKIVLLTNSYIPEFILRYDVRKFEDNITAINNPLSPQYMHYTAPEWKDKEKIVLFVGRLAHEKRVDLILDAWNLLHKYHNEDGIMNDWRLMIVGDGPLQSALMHKASSHDGQNIIFTGETRNPAFYYSKAKMLLLTSEFEGFPMCLLESQSLGCVPISFNSSGGIADILSGDSGVLVPKHDVDGLALSILKFMKDDTLLEAYHKRGVQNIAKYGIEQIGAQWDALIDNI